jgi:hypothetical protein
MSSLPITNGGRGVVLLIIVTLGCFCRVRREHTFTWGTQTKYHWVISYGCHLRTFVPCLQRPAVKDRSCHLGRGSWPDHKEEVGLFFHNGSGKSSVEGGWFTWVSFGTSLTTRDCKWTRTAILFWERHKSWSFWAAITKYHGLGSLNNKHLFHIVLEAETSVVNMQTYLVSGKSLLLGF